MISFKYHGHACVEIQSNQTKVITDPWFGFPFHYQKMVASPRIPIPRKEELQEIDLIHISHIHQDHFCPRSLDLFDRETPVVIAQYPNKNFLSAIQRLGFRNVIEAPAEGFHFAGLQIHCVAHEPFDHSFDSLVIIKASDQTVLLNNDCLLSEEKLLSLQKRFPKIDYGFVGYTSVSPFPVCYEFKNFDTSLELQRIQKESLSEVEKLDQLFHFEKIIPYANGIRLEGGDVEKYNIAFNEPESFEKFGFKKLSEKIVKLLPEQILTEAGLQNADLNCRPAPRYAEASADSYEFMGLLPVKGYRDFFKNYLARIYQAHHLNYKIQIEIADRENAHFFFFDGKAVSEERRHEFDIKLRFPSAPLNQVIKGKAGMGALYYSFQFSALYNFKPEKRYEFVHRWY